MKNTVDKLYDFIVKIIFLLEKELDMVSQDKSKNALKVKENIVDTLNKLVTLITKLNKLNEDNEGNNFIMSDSDEEIIKNFLDKYRNSD